MFEFMKILTLRVRYECLENGEMPAYLGSTIRGIMGHCIHQFYCTNEAKKCFLCEKRKECLYAQYFSSTGGEAGAVNPYTIYVHGQGKERWERGDHCVFDITLFGKAAEHAGIYLDALMAMEQRGWGRGRLRFRLLQVTDPDSERIVYTAEKIWIHNLNPRACTIAPRNAAYACLVFDTPLRIVSGGELFQKLSFDKLIQFLTRRISLLTTKYTENDPFLHSGKRISPFTTKYTDVCLEWDIDEMMRQAAAVKVVEESWREVHFSRYSMNQKGKKLELPSQTGWVLYEGDISPFVPILEIGRYLRIGKGATIGFGHYDIFYDK